MYAFKCFFFVFFGFTGPHRKRHIHQVEKEITRDKVWRILISTYFPISVPQAESRGKLSHFAVGLTMLMKWPIQCFAALAIVTPGNHFFFCLDTDDLMSWYGEHSDKHAPCGREPAPSVLSIRVPHLWVLIFIITCQLLTNLHNYIDN